MLGDFNIAPDDRDVHDPAAWAGQVLCSEPERTAFRRLLDLGLQDTFRRFSQEDRTFSWWDYRAAAFRRNLGLRIDHILPVRHWRRSAPPAGWTRRHAAGIARPITLRSSPNSLST